MNPQLIIEQDGRLLRIAFNRPEDNGVSDSMAASLSAALATGRSMTATAARCCRWAR